MADSRARRDALRGGEVRVMGLVFDTRTSRDPDNTRLEDRKKERFVGACLKHLKNYLKKSSNPQTAARKLDELAALTEADDGQRSCLRRHAKRVFNLLASGLTGGEWAKLLGFPLELAAAVGDRALAAKLLKAEAEIASAVHAAVRGGCQEMVDFLLENGGSTGDLDHLRETPLHTAVRVGRLELMRSLLRRGADVSAVSSAGVTPLYWAAQHGHAAVVEALLAAGADPAIRYTEGELSPLDAAAGFGRIDVLRVLIEHGTDVNAAGADGRTALYWSIYAGELGAIDLLVEAGADLEVRTSAGNLAGSAPLHLALHWNRYDVAAILVESGADVNARDGDGDTALHYAAAAATRLDTVRVVDLLLRMGADETALNQQGESPLDQAGHVDLTRAAERVRWLLTNAAADRAWRRRGYLAMCRAHQDRLQQQPPIRQPRGGAGWKTGRLAVRMKEDVGASGSSAGGGAVDERITGGWGSAAACLVGLDEDGLFRKIVGYL